MAIDPKRLKQTDTANIRKFIVKVKLSQSGRFSIMADQDKVFYQQDPVTGDVLLRLNGRKEAYFMIVVDLETNTCHVGHEVGGVSW